jgi:hypothetical protein
MSSRDHYAAQGWANQANWSAAELEKEETRKFNLSKAGLGKNKISVKTRELISRLARRPRKTRLRNNEPNMK